VIWAPAREDLATSPRIGVPGACIARNPERGGVLRNSRPGVLQFAAVLTGCPAIYPMDSMLSN